AIEEGARTPTEGTPAEALSGVLAGLEEQSVQPGAQDDPPSWARQALGKVREWVGASSTGGESGDWNRSRLSRILWNSSQQLAQEWDERLAKSAFALMDHPGRRVAAAESALRRFVQFCSSSISGVRTRWEQQAQRTQQ